MFIGEANLLVAMQLFVVSLKVALRWTNSTHQREITECNSKAHKKTKPIIRHQIIQQIFHCKIQGMLIVIWLVSKELKHYSHRVNQSFHSDVCQNGSPLSCATRCGMEIFGLMKYWEASPCTDTQYWWTQNCLGEVSFQNIPQFQN